MKVVILSSPDHPQRPNRYVTPERDGYNGFQYTDDLEKAQVFGTSKDAVEAVKLRNANLSNYQGLTFALVPVEVPSPAVRRLI